MPPKWTDYITFYVANYFAHAASLVGRPGESWPETVLAVTCALFLPGSGALRALRSLLAGAAFSTDELERAARAGALCTVMHKSNALRWFNQSRPSLWRQRTFVGNGFRMVPHGRKVHGRCVVPQDHYLVELPPNTPLKAYLTGAAATGIDTDAPAPAVGEPRTSDEKPRLAYTHNIPKILVGLFQVVWGTLTLYKSRGSQIELYGYAAFGLSAAPFVFMSCVNIVMALVTPEYPTMYLVHCPDMDRVAENNRGLDDVAGTFEGIIAAIDTEVPGVRVHADPLFFGGPLFLPYIIGYLVTVCSPLAIVGGLSRFKAGDWSSSSDRGWMMSWLVVGAASSLFVRVLYGHAFYGETAARGGANFLCVLLFLVPLWIPAVGGMVTVGKMLKTYGICTRLSD